MMLGERLTALGEELAARHLTTYAWAAGLGPVLRRAAELNTSWAERFERHEAGGRPPAATGRRRFPDPPDGHPAAARREEPRDDAAVRGTERPLPVDVRARLGAHAGPGAAVMRVLTGAATDAEVRGQRADAVTVGTDVRMRSGTFRPDTPEGLALLAHEASHVTAALRRGGRSGAAAHGGPGPGGAEAEEREALRVERETRRAFGAQGVPATHRAATRGGVPPAGSPASVAMPSLNGGSVSRPNGTAPLAGPPGASPPMRADVDRAEATAAAAAPSFDLDALRRDLVEELMRRVRTDFERGG